MTLFHYTCHHGRKGITRRGFIRPNPQPVLGGVPLVWLTDQEVPNREGLGLTSAILDCDRLQFRYVVTSDEPVRWLEWIARQPLLSSSVRSNLHGGGRQPEHWWIASRPLWAEQDRDYRAGHVTVTA